MVEKTKKKPVVWTMEDYGNLDVAEYVYKLRQGSGSGGGSGATFGQEGEFSLDNLLPGVSTKAAVTTEGGVAKPSPQLQATAQEILKDPTAFVNKAPVEDESLIKKAGGILSNIFDFEDESNSPVETVWDGFLRGLDWGYDRLNQFAVVAVSDLPGGTRTLTYDEAGNISFGQQLVASMGQTAGRLKRNEGQFGDFLLAPFSAIATGASMIDPNSEIEEAGFDITSEEDRKVFDEGEAKFFSGVADFGFVFADPLIAAGVVTKLGRLKYLDRAFKTDAEINAFGVELGAKVLTEDEPLKGIRILDDLESKGQAITRENYDEAGPYAEFIDQSFNGKKSWAQIIQQPEIKDSTHAEAIAMGISEATTRQQAADVIMAALGDKDAYTKLVDEQSDIAEAIRVSERRALEIQATLEPEKWKSEIFKYDSIVKNLEKDVAKAKEDLNNQLISSGDYDNRYALLVNAQDDLVAIKAGIAIDPAQKLSTKELQNAQKAAVDAANAQVEKNKYLQRAIDAAGSMMNTNRGIVSNTAVGRAVGRRRTKVAGERYKAMNERGTWSVNDFFSKDGLKHTIRVFRYSPGIENPAYYMSTKGTGATDLYKESGAITGGLKVFNGEGKQIVINGQTVTVGGTARKESIQADFLKAVSTQEDVTLAMKQFEDSISRELSLFYNLDEDVMDHIMQRARLSMANVAEQIKDPNRQFFAENNIPESVTNLAKAPFLESQLLEGGYIVPFDHLEDILINLNKGNIDKGTLAGMSDSNMQMLVDRSSYTPKGFIGEKAVSANEIFQSFWRPAVLLRLGYPMRNVTEGTVRSMIFNQSLAPMFWTAKGLTKGMYNTRRVKRAEKEYAGLASALGGDARNKKVFELKESVKTLIDEQNILANVIDDVVDKPDKYNFKLLRDGDNEYTTPDNFFKVRQEIPVGGKKADAQWVVYEITEDGEMINSLGFGKLVDAKSYLKNSIEDAQNWTVDEFSQSVDEFSQISPRLAQINKEYNPGIVRAGVTQKSIDAQKAKRAKRIEEINKEVKKLTEEMDVIPPSRVRENLEGSKFLKWLDKELDNLNEQANTSLLFENEFIKNAGGWLKLSSKEQSDIIKLRSTRSEQLMQAKLLSTDDYFAISEYANRRSQKKFVDQGKDVLLDNGVLLHTAFGNERYRDIARKNLSADNTIKATLSIRANLTQSFLLRKNAELFVDVSPNDPGYWDGMQEMLQQYSQSTVGQMLAKGESNDAIVNWILNDPAGRKWRDELDAATSVMDSNNNRWGLIGESPKVANDYVSNVRSGLEVITLGDPRVLDIITRRPPKASELQRYMGAAYEGRLNPVVGNKEMLTGFKKVMDIYRSSIETSFKYVGTMPEDSLVRGPFYSKQYLKFRDDGLALLKEQYKDSNFIPLDRIETLERNAHRRALKDTKEFLYTIDRRTNVGKYGEWVFPFISASQNSVVTLGKLFRRDPQTAAIMVDLWKAPTKAGWEDEEGNIVFPLPKALIPDGVEDFFGIRGVSNIKVSKSGLNVLFPETGFAFVPRPAPLVQVGASTLMKKGLLFTVEPPSMMTSFLGKEDANQLWKGFKDYIYGEENGVSTVPFSADKILPPWANRFYQIIQNDSSTQYAYQYALQARTQELLWRAGEREDYPTSKEIQDRTNGQFILRILGNLLAFTPPDYESSIQPLIDMQRKYDQVYGLEGPMKFSENFGNETLILSNTDTSKNTGGALSNMDAVANIRQNTALIEGLSPRLGDDLSILGIIVNDKASNAEYDASAYRWLTQTEIPGASKNWRDLLSGPEAMRETQRTAGWVEFAKFMGSLDALLEQRGLTSYRSKAASDLNSYRKEKIALMKDDPIYEGWRIDYEDIGGDRAQKTVMVLESALSDSNFMKNRADDPMWQSAALYLEARKDVQNALANDPTDDEKDIILAEWDEFTQGLKTYSNDWAAVANRFLSADDNPIGSQSSVSLFEGGM